MRSPAGPGPSRRAGPARRRHCRNIPGPEAGGSGCLQGEGQTRRGPQRKPGASCRRGRSGSRGGSGGRGPRSGQARGPAPRARRSGRRSAAPGAQGSAPPAAQAPREARRARRRRRLPVRSGRRAAPFRRASTAARPGRGRRGLCRGKRGARSEGPKTVFSRGVPCRDCENCLSCSFYVEVSLLTVTPASVPSCCSSACRPLSAGRSNVQEAVFRDLSGTQAGIFKRENLFSPERSLRKAAFRRAKRNTPWGSSALNVAVHLINSPSLLTSAFAFQHQEQQAAGLSINTWKTKMFPSSKYGVCCLSS